MGKQQAVLRTARRPSPPWLGRTLWFTVVLAALVLLLPPLQRWLDTPIEAVVLEGRLNPQAEASVRELLETLPGTSFLWLSGRDLRHRLEHLPWVASAQVRRQWPARILVSVEQQQPVARWGDDGLLNARGQVFRPGAFPADLALVRLSGPDSASQQALAGYQRLRALADGAGLRLTELEVSSRRSWAVTLAEGPRIELGREQQSQRFEVLLRTFAAVLRDYRDRMVGIDLRYANGFAVTWRQGQPSQAVPAVNKRTARAGEGATGKSIS
ncbi:MAG: cell division protein FtsQ/DivIB [Chromatiales bacterium]|nr:cell division protein FtsQ/DivIB [Chromatiales bacterium]